jgi:hypothetical protein
VAVKSFDNAEFVAAEVGDGAAAPVVAPKLPNDVLLVAGLTALLLTALFLCDENPLLNADELLLRPILDIDTLACADSNVAPHKININKAVLRNFIEFSTSRSYPWVSRLPI